jgi:hypothetical protein
MIILAGKGIRASRFQPQPADILSEQIEGVHGQTEVMTRVFGPSWCLWIVPGTLDN